MSVRKRTWKSGDGIKEGWLVDYKDAQGKRRFKTFTRQRDAKAWEAQTTVDLKAGVHVPDSQSISLEQAANEWLKLPGRERGTVTQYEQHVRNHIIPRLGGKTRLVKLDGPRLQHLRDQLLREVSPIMAKKVMRSVSGILSNAVRLGYVGTNAAASVRFDRSSRHKAKLTVGTDLPSKQEAGAMLNAAEGRWRPIVAVLLFTGLRASELRGLRWSCVDLKGKTLRVDQRADMWGDIGSPKSAAGQRTIPLTQIVLNALREWYLSEGQPKGTELVFPDDKGEVVRWTPILRQPEPSFKV